jgi:hypothetical protein
MGRKKNKASKKKAEEDITPQCEEHGNSSKKRKTESFLLEMENQTVENLKSLVEDGLATIITDNCLLAVKQAFVFVPGLFDPNIAHEIIAFFVKMHPNLDVSKIEETSDSERLMLLTIEQLIDLLEALGATCVFCGDYQVRRYGLACWYEATKLREGHVIPKTPLPQSDWEKLALRNKVELIGTTEFSRDLVLHPVESQDVLHLTYTELFNVFDLLNISEPDTVLTFARLMETLDFCFSYHVKLHDNNNNNNNTNNDLFLIPGKTSRYFLRGRNPNR